MGAEKKRYNLIILPISLDSVLFRTKSTTQEVHHGRILPFGERIPSAGNRITKQHQALQNGTKLKEQQDKIEDKYLQSFSNQIIFWMRISMTLIILSKGQTNVKGNRNLIFLKDSNIVSMAVKVKKPQDSRKYGHMIFETEIQFWIPKSRKRRVRKWSGDQACLQIQTWLKILNQTLWFTTGMTGLCFCLLRATTWETYPLISLKCYRLPLRRKEEDLNKRAVRSTLLNTSKIILRANGIFDYLLYCFYFHKLAPLSFLESKNHLF